MNCAPAKRKHLTLIEKTKLIKELRNGATVVSLSKKYGVAKSTICAIRNQKETIFAAVNNIGTSARRRTLKKGELPRMERILYNWILRLRSKNFPVSGEMIKRKAAILHEKFKENQGRFNASGGWLQKFKSRWGIRLLTISGEKLSACPGLVAPFKERLGEKIRNEELTKDQLYNADESGLFWQLLPEKTYVSLTEKTAPGMKTAKQRVTFLACTNASGTHKLKPLVIGKAKNPRAFKNFNSPLPYKNSKNAWMTSDIFKHWFFNHFVPEVCNNLFL